VLGQLRVPPVDEGEEEAGHRVGEFPSELGLVAWWADRRGCLLVGHVCAQGAD
jgi:hypothetical protein